MKILVAFLLLLTSVMPLTSCVSNDRHDGHEVSIVRDNERDHPRINTVPPARAVYELP